MASLRAFIQTIQEQCDQRRALLLSRRMRAPDELAKWWPGGEANAGKTPFAWVRCFDQYGSWLDRKHPEVVAQERGAKQRAIIEALADARETLTLVTQNADGTPRTVAVYPKSAFALTEISNRNTELAALTDQTKQVAAAGQPSDLDLLLRGYDEIAYQQRVLAWIVTHPGVGLPFAEGNDRPTPPDEWKDLHPADYFAISQAFQRVNTLRLLALDATKKSESRPDFSVFLATLAGSLNVSSPEIWRDVSLSSALAAASERARAHEQTTASMAKKPPGPLTAFGRAQ